MASWELAQLNIALPTQPLTEPELAWFVDALEPVNAAADAAPGFRWRLQTEDGDATAIRAFGDDRLIVNMSVWASPGDLGEFVYRNPVHLAVLRRRRDSFRRLGHAHQVLWWVPAGHRPTVADAEHRLDQLRAHGPGPTAFTLQTLHPTPDTDVAPHSDAGWYCRA